jgi:hypothetical protein
MNIKNNTIKNNKKNDNNYSKEFIDRMTQPISSFPGKDITNSEQEVINNLIKYFEK